MAISSSVENFLKQRKYPFIFTLAALFFCVFLLLYTDDTVLFSLPDPRTSSHSSGLPRSRAANGTHSGGGNARPKAKPNPEPIHPPALPSLLDVVPFDSSSIATELKWELCGGSTAVDYIPCLDNTVAIKALPSRNHMEHRERHCPKPAAPRCLPPLPRGYRASVAWPRSRDMVWYDNVPHPKLVEYKKDQNWVRKSGKYFIFPGGGTQFKSGIAKYIQFIEKTFPTIKWGKNIRVVLDVGCGVASFGGYMLDKNVITMSVAPKDEHEAQIQFALERGIPATLAVIGTQKLVFPDNSYDLIHCARCRVRWDADDGKPLMELNRILRPGGFFIWSATPIYRKDNRHKGLWNSTLSVTNSLCWKVVAKKAPSSHFGAAIFQKPVLSSCYKKREKANPPLCEKKVKQEIPWYVPLDACLSQLPVNSTGMSYNWPTPWPKRLMHKPLTLTKESDAEETFYEDSKHWAALVSDVYLDDLALYWSGVRNVMDMNAGYGGFAAALIDKPVWVMNVIPISAQDTLSIIYDRGLIGVYHDWCEPFNTYPRSYDLLNSCFLFEGLLKRCNIIDMVVEMDRILRPGGYLVVQDTMEVINKLSKILRSLHWSVSFHREQFLVGRKSFWRPEEGNAKR